jgi:hypothetical protein
MEENIMNRKQLCQTITGHILAKTIHLLAVAALLAGFAFAVQPAPLAYAATLTVTAGAPDVLANDGSCSLREAITNANNNASTWADCAPAGAYGADTINLPAGTYTFGLIGAGEDANATGDLDILASGGNLTINGTGEAIIDGGGVDRVLHVCPGGSCGITVILDHVIIQNGHAGASHGGGIYNNATLIVRNGSIIGRSSGGNTTTGRGGGIYNNAGAVTVDASIVSNNTASNGSGIYNYNGGTLNVQNGSTIGGASANIATAYGGGIYNNGGTTIVDASTVSANTAHFGGGIQNSGGGRLTVTNDSIIGGAGAGNTADYGGGIYNTDGTTTVDGSIVSANTADDGGGIYNTATLTVTNGSTIGGASANIATGDGGGIYNWSSGTTTMDASTISNNTADYDGGGIYNNGGTTTVNASIVSNNTADYDGGGIYNNGGTTTVDGSTVSNNTADWYGGGIYNSGTLTVTNGSIIGGASAGNTASDGGGIYNSGGTTTVDGSTVSANTASDEGGGIYNSGGGMLTVTNSSTVGRAGAGNTAVNYGGGIFNWSGGTTTVDGSTVSANTANHCGGIFNSAALTVQNGSTIGGAGAGNTAYSDGGGICQSGIDGTTTVTGSRILYNTATGDGGGVGNYRNVAGATSVTSSCIVGNSASSFVNTQTAQQTATGNWWGAATGPNTPDADTTDGNVDTSGFLAAPILGCPSGGLSAEVYLPIVVKNY